MTQARRHYFDKPIELCLLYVDRTICAPLDDVERVLAKRKEKRKKYFHHFKLWVVLVNLATYVSVHLYMYMYNEAKM